MKMSTQIDLIISVLDDLISNLPSKEAEKLRAKLHVARHDGRTIAWDTERKAKSSATLKSVWETKRAEESFFLKRNGELLELKGLEAAAKAVGVKPQSVRCQLSIGNGVATYTRAGTKWILAKTRADAEEGYLLKYHETGNPDDIIRDNPADKLIANRGKHLIKPTKKK